MGELLLGWKDKSEVYIPPIKKQGFTEDVILRNINLPEEENLIPGSYFDNGISYINEKQGKRYFS